MANEDATKAAAPPNPATAKAAVPPDPATAKAGKKGETVTVRGPAEGRWRAGRQFGQADTVVDLSTITVEQLKAIESDPVLSVKRS